MKALLIRLCDQLNLTGPKNSLQFDKTRRRKESSEREKEGEKIFSQRFSTEDVCMRTALSLLNSDNLHVSTILHDVFPSPSLSTTTSPSLSPSPPLTSSSTKSIQKDHDTDIYQRILSATTTLECRRVFQLLKLAGYSIEHSSLSLDSKECDNDRHTALFKVT